MKWGNITAGNELLRRKSGKEGYVITCPLITKVDDGKFGKTEKGNVWLDPNRTSPYQFYQFWLNVEDAQIGRLLKIFTTFDRVTIEKLEPEYQTDPNGLKRILAKDITSKVHSPEVCDKVAKASNLLFGKFKKEDFDLIEDELWSDVIDGLPKYNVPASQIFELTIEDIISGIFEVSKSEARRLIKGNGIKINQNQIGLDDSLSNLAWIKNRFLLVRKGKNYGVLEKEN